MKYESIMETFKDGDIVIPIYMYKMLPNLNITLDSFIFLMFLRGRGGNIIFDIPYLSKSLGVSDKTIMNYVSELTTNGLLDIKVVKNDKGIMEEFINMDGFYEKLGLNIVNKTNEEINESKNDTSDIFDILAKEIGKQLSPMEIELVKAWKESGYSDDLIKEAIKEAVLSNVASLRYIDKILYTWDRDGLKTVEDVQKNKKKFRDDKEKEKDRPKLEIFDSDDWMDGEHE